MFFVYALVYLVITIPSLITILSWHYTGKPGICWHLRKPEQLELLQLTFQLALRSGFALLAISYTAYVVWHYCMFVAGKMMPSEAEVKGLVTQGYTLIFSVPSIGWGIYWAFKMRNEIRQFFGFGRASFFHHENS